jgi:putative ABC transport system permease protein
MADASDERIPRLWFTPLLRRLPASVRSRLFDPSYEDLRQELFESLGGPGWPGRRAWLRLAFAFRVLALIAACYRSSPGFVFAHPLRSIAAGARALLASNRSLMAHDIRQAVRLLVKQPLFSGLAIVILALGIAGTTTIFSLVDAVLLRPLPFPEAGRLVSVNETLEGQPAAVSPVNYLDWRAQARSFQRLAIYTDQSVSLSWGDRAEAVAGVSASSTFFAVLGVRPELGRWLAPEDDRAPGPSSVVLSHELWMRAFGGARDVLGRQAIFDGQPYTIVGVAPAGAVFPDKTDAWFSLGLPDRNLAQAARGAHYVSAIGRLRPGVTRAEAEAEMRAIAARLAAAYPRTNQNYSATVTGLVDATVGRSRSALLFVLGAAGFLLLLACVNVSGLLMTRAATRRTEMAVRAALGAGRVALVRQAIVESLLLAAIAAALGTLAAAWATGAAVAIVPQDIPRAWQAGIDGRALAFAALTAGLSALLFGSLPALQAIASAPAQSLQASRHDGGLGGSRPFRGALVVVEVALAFVLLVGALLAVRSFDLLRRVPPGFNPEGVLTFTLSLPESVYKEDSQVSAFYRDLLDRLRQVHGVTAAGGVMIPPVATTGFGGTFSIEGRPEATGVDEPRAQMRTATPGYFRTLAIPVLRGRDFDEHDEAGAAPVAIISEAAARRFWPGENPLGKRLRMHVSATNQRQTFREIVGVVGDVKHSRLDLPAAPIVYVPHAQHASAWLALVVRCAGNPALLQHAVTDTVRRADKTLVPLDLMPFDERLAASRADQRFRAILLGLFAISASILAIVGLYAVMTYTTALRRHEMGVRLAVGAGAADIVRLVVGEGLRPVVAGLAIGAVGAVGLSRVMRNLLFGVRPFEPAIILFAAVGFACAAAVACYVPARRASAVDTVDALRRD